jgi:pimeloyl-ACP methyl ester carboxylesterase
MKARRGLRILGFILLAFLILILVGPLLVPLPLLEGTVAEADLAEPDSLFIEVNGITVHYKQMGSGKPVMILLHGFGASVFSWREVMAPLAEYGTVIAYDRPAFGLTERPMAGEWVGESPYSAASQVTLLIGLMDALSIERAILVGNSAGGDIALSVALSHPERVLGLVLVDAAVYSRGGAPTWLRPLIKLPVYQNAGALIVRNWMLARGDRLIELAWHDPLKISAEILVGYRKALQAKNWDRALWELVRASAGDGQVYRLDELIPPVLVVTGDDDRIVPIDQSLRLADEIPGAELAVFRACGHVPQEECPQQFLAAIAPFMEQFR